MSFADDLPGSRNLQLESDLETLPDDVAISLIAWRTASLDREKLEAALYLRHKNEAEKRTVNEIEALIHLDETRYKAKLKEAVAEAEYHKLYERLMAAKRLSALRTAF